MVVVRAWVKFVVVVGVGAVGVAVVGLAVGMLGLRVEVGVRVRLS